MPVSFNQIPADIAVPLYYVEVDPSKAGTETLDMPVLLVGQKLAAGVAITDIPVAIGRESQAIALFGEGSMLHRMVVKFLENNRLTELWCLPLAENAAGVAATGTLAFTGPSTAAGTLNLYIASQLVQVAVASGASATTVGAAVASAINAKASLPVTAAAATGTVTLTAKWKGLTGNDIDLRHSYRGFAAGESLPAGLGLTITAMSGGTTAPDLTNAIAALGDDPYEFVAFPFTDSTSLLAIETEYGFSDAGRWGWMRQLFGHVFSARRDTYAGHITFGDTRNSGVVSIMAFEASTPTPPWEAAAAYAAQAARSLRNDPARPLQTLPLLGVLPAPKEDRFVLLEKNALGLSGLAIQGADAADQVTILRESTTYQLNVYGQNDNAYGLVTTPATLARLIRRQRQLITNKFGRHKLANDGTRFGPGQAIVTPNIVRAELVAHYASDEFIGLVENVTAFKEHLIVERDVNDPNRLNVLYPPDLINQLRIFAVLAQFRLQYTDVETGALVA